MRDQQEDLGYLLNRTVRLLRADLSARLRPHGLTPQQFAVLNDVAIDEESTPARVAERVGLDRPTASGILSRLERDGWIEASTNPQDRRSLLLRPSAKAQATLPALRAAASETSERALSLLDAEGRERLRDGLRFVAEAFEERP